MRCAAMPARTEQEVGVGNSDGAPPEATAEAVPMWPTATTAANDVAGRGSCTRLQPSTKVTAGLYRSTLAFRSSGGAECSEFLPHMVHLQSVISQAHDAPTSNELASSSANLPKLRCLDMHKPRKLNTRRPTTALSDSAPTQEQQSKSRGPLLHPFDFSSPTSI